MHNTVSESLPGTVSPRKLEANRANALKSTGPVSEAGKLRSSRNAKRHAALASAATLLAQPNHELESLLARYVADFRPSSVHEETLVQEIAASAWRMKHLAGIETGLLAAQAQVSYVAATEDPKPIARWPEPMSIACPRCGHGVPPKEASEPEEPSLAEAPADVQSMMMGVAWATGAPSFSLLVRYQAQARRDYYRALKELERVRTGEAGYLPQEPPPEMARPILPEPQPAASETKPPAPAPRTAAASASSQTNPTVAAPAPLPETSNAAAPASYEVNGNNTGNNDANLRPVKPK